MVGWIGRSLSWFGGSVGVGNIRDNQTIAKALHCEAERLFPAHVYRTTDTFEYALELTLEISEELGLPHSLDMMRSLGQCLEQLVISNAILPPEIDWAGVDHKGDEGLQLRSYLERHKRFHENHAVNNRRFREGLSLLLRSICGELSTLPLASDVSTGFGVNLGELIPDPHRSIDLLVGNVFNSDLQEARLFERLRDQFERNICSASGIEYQKRNLSTKRATMPRDYSGGRQDLFDTYLSGTPFARLLDTPLPFSIPKEARFEHTHIVGGTGHGKTQLLAHLIMQDLGDIITGRRKSIVVVDSQGDLIRKLSSMAIFNPTNLVGLADKLVIIDPSDVEFPTALNIFAINQTRLEQYGPVEQERVFNGAVELYEHFFQGLLGAELTQKQGVAFSYLARMMLELPNATIFTLRDLMDDPQSFKGEIEKLSGSIRMFFEREFLSASFNQTRRQISRRLWGILAIPAFERMFGQSEHKVDLYELLNSGKIILINTSRDLLKAEGSAIFGKFFLSAIAQAVGERAVQSESERTETIIYLDEAHEYADQSLEILLNQGRKYRAGVVVAHQFLDQLDSRIRQTLLANASVKMVGGLSHKDNQSFSREMNSTIDFLASMRKRESATEFALWIKNVLHQPLRLSVPFGLLEGAKLLDHNGKRALLDQNRELYCVKAPLEALPSSIEAEVVGAEPTTETISEGRGGTQHREIQQMIKALGHDFGFGVSIEAPCLESEGAIDALLTGEQTSIAFEVSVSTSAEHELENLKKCLAEQIDRVVCVSPDDTHRLAIQNLCIDALPQTLLSRLCFLNPSSLNEFLTKFDERETTLIRGYEVVTRTAKSDPRDVEYRKSRIRQVLERRLG